MTTMGMITEVSADSRNSQSTMNHARKFLTRPLAEYGSFQQLQIQKLKLAFLRRCTTLKRPPPSLRISGASALSDAEKLPQFSKLETELLNTAIRNKVNEVRTLTNLAKDSGDCEELSESDRNSLKKHYDQKISFYGSQNETKWSQWPQKPNFFQKKTAGQNLIKKAKNFKKRQNRKERKVDKLAKKALESGSIVILVNEDVPKGAIALLGKGLGYIPTPETDECRARLDMRLFMNKVINISRAKQFPISTTSVSSNYELPQKLRQPNYTKVEPTWDKTVQETVHKMADQLDEKLRSNKSRYKCTNLSKAEQDGLVWLQKKISENKIAITEADKGGAILIVDPELLRKKTLEKLHNTDLYEKVEQDPTKDLHKELVNHWIRAKTENIITAREAKYVMGISDNMKSDKSGPTNHLSTLPHYRPGKAYFYPCLKIHKCKREDLKPGVEPPTRLITALQDGITKRSDVFLADKFLGKLEKDFCEDLLIDSNDALLWLDSTDDIIDHNVKIQSRAFTFDYKSLYDSLSPELVIEALEVAMEEAREDWTDDLKRWIVDLAKMSLKSSVGQFEDNFYRQRNGIPTGGSLCVQLANITVYYVMRKEVYSKESMMTKVSSLKRYIDDGAGFFSGTRRQFSEWINSINDKLSQHGLNIDEHTIAEPGQFVAFLDIQFCFDVDGKLQTDLYVKPTDSRAYLQYGSSHPNHIYSGIVYSQCYRLRKIINDDARLHTRISEIKSDFENSNYPLKMVENISAKVLSMERKLPKPKNSSNSSIVVPKTPSPRQIRLISTFGSDTELVNIVKNLQSNLQASSSFASEPNLSSTPTKKRKGLIQFVKKTGASLSNKLVKNKRMALGGGGHTVPCKHKNCQCCRIITTEEKVDVNGIIARSCKGSCLTYNVIYCFVCGICKKGYTGRSVQRLSDRTGQHRRNFYSMLKNITCALTDEMYRKYYEYSLGLHLIENHNLTSKNDFENSYKLFLLETCSPKNLEVNEHKFIHKLNTLKPHGLNAVDPFGIPLLNL